MDNKVNQHYVWQKYLEPWTIDNKLTCLRNKKDIFCPNPRNIASQRYFYRINGISENDCNLIRKIFIERTVEPMRSILERWILPIEDLLKVMKNVDAEVAVKIALKEETDLYLKNILENLHMKIENDGITGLLKLQAGQISFLLENGEDQTEDVDFISYLSFQYFRTKKMKQSVKEACGQYESLFNDFDSAFNVIVLIFSTLFGYNIYERIKGKEFKCYLLRNFSDIAFITGDQPVINLHANFDAKQETTSLSLYYPLSPIISLLITRDQVDDVKCSIEKVKEYNDMIACQSLELIFANNDHALEPYIL